MAAAAPRPLPSATPAARTVAAGVSPAVPRTVAAGVSPAAPAPVEPPPKPRAPQHAWKDALASLGPMSRVFVEQHAAFVAFTDGVLALGVRNERHLHRVREMLRDADFAGSLPGFRNVAVSLTGEGRTGKEVRAQHEERLLREAKDAADRSDVLKRLIATFGATVEQVEPDAPGDTGPVEDEVVDE